jgi:8-oxo-dGTP pyrophosphatase MutT (NUDIX family)
MIDYVEGSRKPMMHIKNNICRNCGGSGHLYKYCKKPIMSFGIICYRKKENSDDNEYLMIQRRNSLSFVEFIRGKYEMCDSVFIKHLLSLMTIYERKLLQSLSFDSLWNQVWFQSFSKKQLTNDYSIAKLKFQLLRECGTLQIFLQQTTTRYREPEWGFPKGRRRLKERDIDCAVREFCEETGLAKSDIKVDDEPFQETFYGTNGVLYTHIYYTARIVKNIYKHVYIDYCNPHQAREVQKIKWFSKEDVLRLTRDYNPERKEVFLKAVSTFS